jgi:hypothetical protein
MGPVTFFYFKIDPFHFFRSKYSLEYVQPYG